ncbi:hypothetical protein G3574_17525 [Noviherbaspirillum sp. 17J57-3]|uniref:Uncharacterized protein n=1 Tax=Noviherbaspirillum galbum TaxID=2709383 RepID=A0A6B3SVG6_9BURK|nr:hypothetical protein [Noviherbaspirillum galbum]
MEIQFKQNYFLKTCLKIAVMLNGKSFSEACLPSLVPGNLKIRGNNFFGKLVGKEGNCGNFGFSGNSPLKQLSLEKLGEWGG